jgi:hypothetical protein
LVVSFQRERHPLEIIIPNVLLLGLHIAQICIDIQVYKEHPRPCMHIFLSCRLEFDYKNSTGCLVALNVALRACFWWPRMEDP